MTRRFKTTFLFVVAGIGAGAGIALAANGQFLLGAGFFAVGFVCAWQALYLLTVRSLP